MKMNKKLLTVLAALIIIGTLIGCNKKNDTALAEMNAKLEAMQAELDKAKSGNAAPEEIAKLETAVAEIAQQEQAELKQEASIAIDTMPTSPGNFQMNRIGNGMQLQITKYIGSDSIVIIPAIVNTFEVIRIEDNAFAGNKTITNVIIPNGVTSIGEKAFYNCTNLTSVAVPASVTEIGTDAFPKSTNEAVGKVPKILK